MNKKPVIENYIEINGNYVLMDSLPKEKRREIAAAIQDSMMKTIGFKRKENS